MSFSFESIDHEIWWIIVGSKGGKTRGRILELLSERPMNAHQLSKALGLNYRTITHHLELLLKNNLVVAEGPKYGLLYFPSHLFSSNIETFKQILRMSSAFTGMKEMNGGRRMT
ncbi:MAG: ArsR/SmtB family transcription factor [Nitrososphaerales archaeon]